MKQVQEKVQNYGLLLKIALLCFVAIVILGYSIYLTVQLYKLYKNYGTIRKQETGQPESQGEPAGTQIEREESKNEKAPGERKPSQTGPNITAAVV